jgi:hypothetical protein
MASHHSASMSRSLERMRRDTRRAPAMRFVREATMNGGACDRDRTTEVYEMPGWSLADWSLAFLSALAGLVAGFAAFVVLTTTQLAPDNVRLTPVAGSVAVVSGPVATKVPEVLEAVPAPSSSVVAIPADAPEPRAVRDSAPRARKARHAASLSRAERRVRRAASAR